MADHRRLASSYSREEIEYLRKRILIYLDSGFSLNKARAQFNLSVSVFDKLFKDCALIKTAVEKSKNNKSYGKS